MIDLHTHILPGMDDGSPNSSVSLEMLRLEREQGCEAVVLSPHYYRRESVDSFLSRRDAAFCELTRAAKAQSLDIPQFFLASEVAFFSGISRSDEIKRLCIKNTRTLLLELPYSSWQDFEIEETVSLILDKGLQLVLVHPERFVHYYGNESKLRQLLEFPVALQVNSGSLINIFTRKTALDLLTKTRLPVFGSDCHNLGSRPPNIGRGRSIIEKYLGTYFLEKTDLSGMQLCVPD